MCLVALGGGWDRQPQDELCARSVACISKRPRPVKNARRSATPSRARPSHIRIDSGSTDTYSRRRRLVTSGESRSGLVKVFTPVADIQFKHCPVQFAFVFAFLPLQSPRHGYAIDSFAMQVPTVSFQVCLKCRLKPGRSIPQPKSKSSSATN